MSAVTTLADDYWAYFRGAQQLWNVDRGDVDQIEGWDDLSPEGVGEHERRLAAFAARADDIVAADPEGEEAPTLAAISFSARSTAVGLPWARDRTLVSAPVGFASLLPVLVPRYALVTRRHGEGYVAKLASLPSFVDGWVAGLREGIGAGRVATAHGVAGSIEAYERMLATDVVDDPLAAQSPPEEATTAEVETWRSAVHEAIARSVRPALARLHDVLRDEVLPAARSDEEAGLCHLPGGDEGYAALLWASTSTALTPDEVHQLGLEQLERLDDEYRSLAGPLLGTDDPAMMLTRLREDPTLRYASADEIVRDAHAVLARAQAVAPRWFTRLPAASCRPVAVDAGFLAYYAPPSPDGQRGGTFFFNASDPSAWGRYQLEATTFHEAVPGHHLQLALAQELDLHPVHRELEVTSYVEGWGLYAERLADEMGLYSSPLQRVGMLTLDSLRACRLVIDTGLHAHGWSRQRAVEFLLAHVAQSRSVVEDEIDRYICSPGQAASYMVGRLELERLRAEATARLGPRFDIRQFHDVVLGGGMVTLDQLARRVEIWTARVLDDR